MSLRIAVFTHDAYGLGHVRRATRIVGAVCAREPAAAVLLVTGSPATHLLRDLPAGADYLKLPTIVTSGGEGALPSVLSIGVAELTALRGELTCRALEVFEPDVFLVDNFPLGTRLELLPALRAVRHRPTRTALGLRDVVDPPQKVRKDWSRGGLFGVVERYYDRVLVYGMREVLDAAREYGLSESVARRVRYCGYVAGERVAPGEAERARERAGVQPGFLLATVGGGGDGRPLLEAFLGALERLPRRPALVVTGEFMSAEDRAAVCALARGRAGVVVREHVAELPALMAGADLVVAMGGYNTSAEILASGANAVLVPRTWRSGEHADRGRTGADDEQLVRAEALARLGAVRVLHPAELSPVALADAMAAALAAERPAPAVEWLLDGAERVAAELCALAREGSARP